MPTPFELFQDPIIQAVFALYGAMLAWEALRPARALPRLRLWWLRGTLALVVYVLVSSYVPLWLAEPLATLRLVDAASLGTVGGAAVAWVTYELIGYGWHRLMHESDFLFRTVHQMHHSAERLDVASAFWFSPLDMVGWTLVSTIPLAIAGFTPAATTLFMLVSTLNSIFQHANIRTPHWMGYLVQRPEAHSLHHARGKHRDNYAGLPVFDILFGTFVNPSDFSPETGFGLGASSRVLEMVMGREVYGDDALSAAQPAE